MKFKVLAAMSFAIAIASGAVAQTVQTFAILPPTVNRVCDLLGVMILPNSGNSSTATS